MRNQSKIFGFKDAYLFLGVSSPSFCVFIDRYKIPFRKAARGRIFFEEDLVALQEARKQNAKPTFEPPSKKPKLHGQASASEFIGISPSRFQVLLKNYDLPFQETSCGRVFFEDDLKAFMESEKRMEKMKHGR